MLLLLALLLPLQSATSDTAAAAAVSDAAVLPTARQPHPRGTRQ